MTQLCTYGCGEKAIHQFKNGKWCCSKSVNSCSERRKIQKGKFISIETRKKMSISHIGKKRSDETREKIRIANIGRKNPMYGKKFTDKHKERISSSQKTTLEDIKRKHPLFFKIEEIEFDEKTGKFKVHCKNHNCKNSKEKGGYFLSDYSRFSERIFTVENGYDGSYFYCSNSCKQECPLFNLQSDPFKNKEKYYTDAEYGVFKQEVLRRDNNECIYCGEKAEHVHHIRPVKLEPFFALDPDYGIAVCSKCHYEYGHKTGTECSTGQLGNKICVSDING